MLGVHEASHFQLLRASDMTDTSSQIRRLLNLALDHHRQGQMDQAEGLYQRILKAEPRHADALHLLGTVAFQRGDIQRAETLIQKACDIKPNAAMFFANLALVLERQEKWASALDACERVLSMTPHDVEVLCLQGKLRFRLGHCHRALISFEHALKCAPNSAAALHGLGLVKKALGHLDEAEQSFRKALACDPDSPEALNNLGALLLQIGQAKEAERVLLRAIDLNPDLVEALVNLGMVQQLQSKEQRAIQNYDRALSLQPDRLLWKFRRASVCPVIPENAEAIHQWRLHFVQALNNLPEVDLRSVADDLSPSHAEPPFHMVYHGLPTLDLKVQYASRFRTDEAGTLDRDHEPRVAVLVTPGHEGVFMSCNHGLLEMWGSQSGRHLTLAATSSSLHLIRPRITNPRIRYLQIFPALPTTLKVLQDARLNLIHYWEVGSDALNYFLPFFRPAPVQTTSWGTSDTSGLSGIDHYLSCQAWENEKASVNYRESLILLDRIPVYFTGPNPQSSNRDMRGFLEHKGVARHERCYLCAQNLMKLHPEFDALLGRILHEDPQARVLLVEGIQPHWTRIMKKRLRHALGKQERRITFLPRMSHPDYLSLIHQADVLLDSIHFSGGVTSLEALSMGLPVVTLPGRFARGKFTLGAYRQMGVMDGVARDPEHYVEIAVQLATDARFRNEVRERLLASRNEIIRDKQAAAEFEQTLVNLAG